MNESDKYLLLISLSVFFACLAVSLVSLYKPAGRSYMYTPQADASQAAPMEDITRQYGKQLPQSVLHYPLDAAAPEDNTVTCYLKAAYEKRIAEIIAQDGVRLAVKASMEGDALEIYVNEDGDFSAFVIGPDAIDQPEACEVARGTGWQPATP